MQTCTHPAPGACVWCVETPATLAARAALDGRVLHASADNKDVLAQARTLLQRLEDRLQRQASPGVPTGLLTDRSAKTAFPTASERAIAVPRYLTPGPGGTFLATARRLATLPDSRINAILNASPWSEDERRALAATIRMERRA